MKMVGSLTLGRSLPLQNAYLQDTRFALVQDRGEILHILYNLGLLDGDILGQERGEEIPDELWDNVPTGMLVRVGEGEYESLWATYDRNPCLLTAWYREVIWRR